MLKEPSAVELNGEEKSENKNVGGRVHKRTTHESEGLCIKKKTNLKRSRVLLALL